MAPATWLSIAAGLLIVVHADEVAAANSNKARVAPAFWGDSCIVTVDRSVDPVARLGLAIPFEDFGLTEDELDDSRRFQFVALCEDHPVLRELPNWIALSDAERALDIGLIDALPPVSDVLESAPGWQSVGHDGQPDSCVVAITHPEDRMPITCSDTADGIEWDTTGVAAGTYVVRSYTFEPAENLWARRPGLVRVVDGNIDPGPAVTLTAPRSKATAYEKPGFVVTGCVVGASGTSISLQWAEAAAVLEGGEDIWVTAHEFNPDEGTFEVLFVPPPETVYKALYLRAVATDPQGRTWVTHANHEIVVLPDCGQADGSEFASVADGCGVVPDEYVSPDLVVVQPTECDFEPDDGGIDDSGGGGDGNATAPDTGSASTSGDGTGGSGGAADEGGGGCRTSGSMGGGFMLALLLPLLGRMRRQP